MITSLQNGYIEKPEPKNHLKELLNKLKPKNKYSKNTSSTLEVNFLTTKLSFKLRDEMFKAINFTQVKVESYRIQLPIFSAIIQLKSKKVFCRVMVATPYFDLSQYLC